MKNNSKNRKLLEIRIINHSKKENKVKMLPGDATETMKAYWKFVIKYSILIQPTTKANLRKFKKPHRPEVKGVSAHTIDQINSHVEMVTHFRFQSKKRLKPIASEIKSMFK